MPICNENVRVIKKYLAKILKMYIFWMLLYTPLEIYHFIKSGTPIIKELMLYARGLFFFGQQYNSWQLWYLLSVIYSLCFLIVLSKIRKIKIVDLIVLSSMFTVISFGIDCFVGVDINVGHIKTFQSLVKNLIANGRLFQGMVYIPIGMILAKNKIPRLINVLLCACGTILLIISNNVIVNSYTVIVLVVGLFGIIEEVKLSDNNIYCYFRKMSTVIFLIHMYVWTAYCCMIYGERTYGFDCFFVTSIVSLIIACVVVNFSRLNTRKST